MQRGRSGSAVEGSVEQRRSDSTTLVRGIDIKLVDMLICQRNEASHAGIGINEFTYAEIGLGTTSVTGDMEMAFEDSWAHFCVHHFNQDGLVREGSRLTAWLGRMSPRSRE
jgi:hypothetical protein